MKAYCVTCKDSVDIENAQKIVSGNRARVAGNCKQCGGKVSVFVKKDTVMDKKKKK